MDTVPQRRDRSANYSAEIRYLAPETETISSQHSAISTQLTESLVQAKSYLDCVLGDNTD